MDAERRERLLDEAVVSVAGDELLERRGDIDSASVEEALGRIAEYVKARGVPAKEFTGGELVNALERASAGVASEMEQALAAKKDAERLGEIAAKGGFRGGNMTLEEAVQRGHANGAITDAEVTEFYEICERLPLPE